MTDYTELKTAIEYILNQGALEREFIEDADALDAAWAVYEALGPTDILALIADIEDARNGMKHSCAIRLKKRIELLETQRDQLIADNERLTNRLEVDPRHDYDGISTRDATVKVLDEQVDQLKAENERLRADYAGLARFNPEWDRAAAAQDSVREHMAMVVQLKAEIAGLRTGYEAYEQVVRGLKAEVDDFKEANARPSEMCTARRNHLANAKKAAGIGPMDDLAVAIEALRKDAERYQWLRDGCGIVEYRAIATIGSGMLPSGETLDAVIDGAMSNEAQS